MRHALFAISIVLVSATQGAYAANFERLKRSLAESGLEEAASVKLGEKSTHCPGRSAIDDSRAERTAFWGAAERHSERSVSSGSINVRSVR